MTLDEGLRNWGRYYRNKMRLTKCGSAEGNYRSNWRQWRPLSDIEIPEPCDIRSAEDYERAWVSLDNRREKDLLKYLYVWQLHVKGYVGTDGRFIRGVCEMLKLRSMDKYREVEGSAHYHIRLIVEGPEK